MKKMMMGIMITAGLLVLVSCGPKEGIGPVELPENQNTPTPIIVPTCTPTATPTPDPAVVPKVTPTEAVKSSVTPSPEPTATPSPEPTATPTPEPTATPSPKPTATPTPKPTATPSPKPTATPSPEPTATPTPSPTPTVNPEPLVTNGWQKTISIDEKYTVVFPELFRDSYVSKTDRDMDVIFTNEQHENVAFVIGYKMLQSMDEILENLGLLGELSVTRLPEQKRAVYVLKTEEKIYRGILLESQYAQELLGTSFGEEEWISGVMQVVFSYPVDSSQEYETLTYGYYIIENKEE